MRAEGEPKAIARQLHSLAILANGRLLSEARALIGMEVVIRINADFCSGQIAQE